MKRRATLSAIFLVAFVVAVVAAGAVYHGNTNSKIFHKSSCRYYNCKHCTKEFTSREDAIKAGYRACKVCRP
jgi:methylphosphotriester-DNA--protein-cysteine methyltransferase